MAEKVNLQKKIQEYRQTNPKLKNLSDENILSIMVQNGVISLAEEQKRSIFANNKTQNSNLGLHIEKSTPKSSLEKTIYLQSGRKVVYTKTANGKLALKYYGTDGTQLNPDYFKKVEGQISISADGTSYTLTKNGKKSEPIKVKDPTQGAIDQNLARLNNEEKRLNKTKKEQGFIGSSWDWIKNKTGIGDGSDKAQKQIEAERKLLNQIKTGKISKKDFKDVTGLDYSKENLEKFKRGELSQATAKIDGYKEGQEMASDVAGDMISGIAAVGIYTAAVAAAPFTGGASIAIGIAAATASGALIKAGVKALDTVGTDRKYTLKDFGHDAVTGAFSGALAPITGGLGSAVGKTVATKLGIQAVKEVGKEVAEEVVEQSVKQGVKQGLKTALTNPTGYEYVGGTLVKRGSAMAAEMATDGALGGAIDGGFRAGLDNDWDADAIIDGTIEGGVGGALMSPIIGGGFKAAGKGGQKLGEKIKGNKGANEATEAAIGKEISEGSEEVSFKSQANENMSKRQGKTLEGGVKDTELEEVAPFAKHLTEERQIDDIAIPNKESLEIVNGDFVNGEFVPDGSTTYYTNGNNPLNKKSVTVQCSSYPSFEVAQNRKELTTQILGILGEKKIPKHLTKNFDEFLAKNPDIKISDISILIGRLNHIGHAKNFITEQGLRSIKDFKCFKANVENYAEFLYKLEHPEFGYSINDINRAKIADYHFSDFIKFIEKIDSENFKANCNAYLNMRGYLKNALNVKDFLTTVHDKKCLERIQILDDFNFKHTNWSGNYDRYNNIKPYFYLHELSNDKEFANLLERMEYCKKAKRYSSDDASLILHVGDNLEKFKKFDSSIPEPIKIYSYKYFKDISANSPDNIDKFIEFCNKMPENWFKSLFDTKYGEHYYREERCNIFMTFGAKCYDENSYQGYRPDGSFGWCNYQPKEITPDKILKRLDIAKKVAHLACHKGEAHPYYINMILTDYNIKDIDKAQVFLNTVDENYLKRIKLDDCYNKNFDLFKLINSDNIDGMIANAKLYNELPENLRELFAKRSNETFDVPVEDFKARINILQKYGDVLDETTLLDVFTGKNTTDVKPYERLSQLPEELKFEASTSGNIKVLGILGDAEYQKFIRLFGGTNLKRENFRNILYNLEDNKNLFGELSYDELKVLPPNIFERNCDFIKIDKLKKHIQLVPEKLRPYMKDTTELVDPHSSWFNTEYSTAKKAQEAIQELNKLSDEDLAVMGSKTITQWIDNARYSDIAHDLPLQKIEELKKIPKGALELLQQDGRDMYNLLVSKSNIDLNMITERYNLLAERNLSIDTSNFYKLINAGDNSYSIITTLLKDSNRKIEDINLYISCLPSEETVKRNSDFIFKYLINNPQNKTEDIPCQFAYIYRNKSFEYARYEKYPEHIIAHEKQIEFAQNVVKNLIKHGDIHNEKGYDLLRTFLYTLREYNAEYLPIEEVKFQSMMKIINSKSYDRIEMVNCYHYISRYFPKEQTKLIEDMINHANYDIHTIMELQHQILEKDNPDFTHNFISMLSNISKNNDIPEKYLCKITNATNSGNMDLTKRLCSDKNFPPQRISEILSCTTGNNIALAERLCTDKTLNFPIEYIPRLLQTDCTELTLKRLDNPQFVKDIIDICKSGDSVSTLFIQAYNLIGKNSLSELTKTEKREFIEFLLANKNNITSGYVRNFEKGKIPILPTNTEEYTLMMKKAANSLNISLETASTEQIAKFNKTLDNISHYLKSANLSEFKEINLSMPHTEFISRVQDIIKHLPTEEQSKIQDYYGFKIINGKLSGYPNLNAKDLNLSEITDKESILAINNLKNVIDKYINNNFIIVKDNPLLNQQLKELSTVLPEIFNQIDGSNTSVNMIKSLQKIVKNSNFEKLSESDKRVMLLATLLHNTDKTSNSAKESSFDAYFIAKKFNMSDKEAKKVYSTIESSNFVDEFMKTHKRPTEVNIRAAIIGQEREDKFDLMAFKLKEGNNFELAQMLYSSKYQDGFTRYFDKILSDRIQQMKASDFILPQTQIETYLAHAKQKAITRENNTYNVQVVSAKDIKDFYAYIHTPEASFATGGTRGANFANFDAFAVLNDDKVICTSYVGNDLAGLVKEYHNGFIFDIQNDKQYVGYGKDIFSLAKNIPNMIVEYFRDRGFQANRGRGAKYQHRTMISNVLKSLLYGKDYYNMTIKLDDEITKIKQKYKVKFDDINVKKENYIRQKFGKDNITYEQFKILKTDKNFMNIENQINLLEKEQLDEIQNISGYVDLKEIDKLYAQRLEDVKAKLGNLTMTLENIEQIDPELAEAYRKFLKRNGTEHTGEASLLRSNWHNEVLVSNPKISAIFTDDIDKIPEEYLIKAQEENLPIVVIS